MPGALGFGGAAACANLAKRSQWSTAARAGACAGVAVLVWTLFLGPAVGTFFWSPHRRGARLQESGRRQ